ncbi:MAG TPA: LapA family protein [Leptolyngbya sp.]|nr:LapA family protein [Leptolyngbya sp.]
MRQVNFLIIFVICLALVLFGIENTEPAVIHVVKNIQFQAPLSVELILSAGIGAVLAWVFSVWSQVQRSVEVRKEVTEREERIHELEDDLERYRVELEEQRMLPAAQTVQDAESQEIYAQ